jgi:two-component system, NtrC family, sensor histidine kinase GlrK
VKLTIFKRLIFSYIMIMLFIILLAGYITVKLNQLNNITRSIADVESSTIVIVERLLDAIISQVSFEKKFLISKDPDFSSKFWELQGYVIEDLKSLAKIANTNEKKELFGAAGEFYDRYISLFRQETELIANSQDYNQDEYQENREKAVAQISQILRICIEMARSDRDQKIERSSQTTYYVLRVVIFTAGSAIVLGILISFLTARGINRAIVLLQRKTHEIAQGKFEDVPSIMSPPEIKALADDFRAMCARLKELDQMKIDFISHVSHDLRTPLTAIRESSSMLLEGTYADVPEKQQELLSITKEECERLIDSVNKILDLSRMEAKMMDYHFRPCSLAPIIQRGVFKVAPIAMRKSINLELKPPPDIPLVNIDEERIDQVIQNLIGNALKYTTSGDSVVINIRLLPDEHKSFVEVCVSDTGCGIQEENLELIFDKFRRIESGKGTVRGTGLGLSLAKHIIAAHGGKIWAESNPGSGSTFCFTLPVS